MADNEQTKAVARYPIQLTLKQVHAIMSGRMVTEKLWVSPGIHIEVQLFADDYEEVDDDDFPDLLDAKLPTALGNHNH